MSIATEHFPVAKPLINNPFLNCRATLTSALLIISTFNYIHFITVFQKMGFTGLLIGKSPILLAIKRYVINTTNRITESAVK